MTSGTLWNLAVGLVAATALLVAACSSSSADEPSAPAVATAEATATAAPTATMAPIGAGSAAATPMPTATAATDGADDALAAQLELGERIFLTDAAEGVGCQFCHGPTALGDIGIGPNIQGKLPADIAFALETYDLMFFIHLLPRQIEAVSAYLQTLGPRVERTPTPASGQ